MDAWQVGIFDRRWPGGWCLSSSSDPVALAVVDGTGLFKKYGPHYSRRTPGSRTFTGVGQEIVLIHESGAAVWAVVRQRTPSARGSGASRGRAGHTDIAPRYVWRNMLFRRLPECPLRASDLIRSATDATYDAWFARYGELPQERLRTEIGISAVRSTNPGCCYKAAGYIVDRVVRGKLYLWAPLPERESV
jgi:hypothetical protein